MHPAGIGRAEASGIARKQFVRDHAPSIVTLVARADIIRPMIRATLGTGDDVIDGAHAIIMVQSVLRLDVHVALAIEAPAALPAKEVLPIFGIGGVSGHLDWPDLARSGGFEPPTCRVEICCSIQLNYERIVMVRAVGFEPTLNGV